MTAHIKKRWKDQENNKLTTKIIYGEFQFFYCIYFFLAVTKCDLPPIDNGAFVCGTDAPKLQMCYIACENNYGVNPLGIFGQQFKCNLKESIQKLVDTMKTQEPCQRKSMISIS